MSEFVKRILAWYKCNGRQLPWRGHPDPYAIWVSEIMLQQTRVKAVIPYFERWMSRFPTIIDLAIASEQDVLNIWEGLGYYSRARNMQRAAKLVISEYGGELPHDIKMLTDLPGIGRSTAGAIASMAFGMNEPILDGNIRRVLARLFNYDKPVDTPVGRRYLWDIQKSNLPEGRAGDYNQAIMDLGAMVCMSRDPDCGLCPINDLCQANALGVQNERPLLKRKPGVPKYIHSSAIIRQAEQVLLAHRPSKGLLGGMWEFPNGRINGNPKADFDSTLEAAYGLRIRVDEPFGMIKHAYTHFRVTVHIFCCELVQRYKNDALRWVNIRDLDDYPMGKIDRWIAQKLSNNI